MQRWFLMGVLIFAAVTSANAVQLGTSGGAGAGFSCPPDDEMCSCDGTFTDCSNMKVNCVDGTMQCKREGDIERCWCQRKSAVRVKPGGTVRPPIAPLRK